MIQVWESSELDGPVDKHTFDINKFAFDSVLTTLTDLENKQSISMEDDGNGVLIKIDKKKIKLDYYECVQVLILLQINTDQLFEFREAKIIKKF
jgi:hypothetical protein